MTAHILPTFLLALFCICCSAAELSINEADEQFAAAKQFDTRGCKEFRPIRYTTAVGAGNYCARVMSLGRDCCCQVKRVGRYYVAMPCPEPCPTVSPTPSMSPSPSPTCIGSGRSFHGWVAGDPHIRTYDNLPYDCQACGEFVISKSPSCPEYELQGRFYIPPNRLFSVVSDMVIKHEGVPKIQMSITRKLATPHSTQYYNNQCRISFFIDGVATVIHPNQLYPVSPALIQTYNSYVNIRLPGNMLVQVKMWKFLGRCLLSVHHFLPPSASVSDIKGLLGNADLNMWNDWFDTNGGPITVPTNHAVRNAAGQNYCTNNWRIPTASASLFTYEAGLSQASIANCGQGSWDGNADRMLAANSRKIDVDGELERICRGDLDCLTDGKYGGVEAAKEMIGFVNTAERDFKVYEARLKSGDELVTEAF